MKTNPYQPPPDTGLHLVTDDQRPRSVCPVCRSNCVMLWQWLLQPFGRCGTCGTPLLIQRSLFQRLWIPLSAIKVAIFAVLMGTMGTNLSWLALILAIALILADGVAVVRTGRLTKRRGSL